MITAVGMPDVALSICCFARECYIQEEGSASTLEAFLPYTRIEAP